MKVDVKEKKPFLKISLHGVTAEGIDRQIDALEDYFDEIGDAFEEKVPRLLQEIEELA